MPGPTRIQTILRSRRRGPGTRRRRAARPRFPTGTSSSYGSYLASIFERLKAAIREVLVPGLGPLLSRAAASRPGAARVDDTYDDVDALVRAAFDAFNRTVPEAEIRSKIDQVAGDVARYNRRDMGRVLAAVLGVDPLGTEQWLAGEAALFLKSNAALITKLEDETRGKVQAAVAEAVKRGTRVEALTEEILGIDGIVDVSISRARLIARDQVSKFNGDLTRIRQTEVGIEEYVWATAGDERVRETHAAHAGKTYRWDSPPADTGHPGEDYQCRCVAIPVLPEASMETPST